MPEVPLVSSEADMIGKTENRDGGFRSIKQCSIHLELDRFVMLRSFAVGTYRSFSTDLGIDDCWYQSRVTSKSSSIFCFCLV